MAAKNDEVFAGNSFAVLGLVILILSVFPLLIALPFVIGEIRNAAIFTGTLWLLIAWFRLKIPFRMSGPIALVLLLQAWSGVSILWVSYKIARSYPVTTLDFFLLRYVFVFYMASVVVTLVPRWKEPLTNALLGMFALLALTGLFDFVAPEVWFPVRRAMMAAVIDRPVGLSGYHSHLAILCNFGCAILCGRLVFRKLRWWETSLFVILALAGVAAQARAHIPGLAICVAFFLAAAVVRNRMFGVGILAAAAATISIGLIFFPSRFETLLNTDVATEPTLMGRKVNAWPQVDYIMEHFPWTGIGPEPVFFGNVMMGRDKWAPFHALDAGFLLLVACYGYIGLGIGILIFFALAMGMVTILWQHKNETPFRVSTAVTMLLFMVSVCISMYANNVINWDDAMVILFFFGGMMVVKPSEEIARG